MGGEGAPVTPDKFCLPTPSGQDLQHVCQTPGLAAVTQALSFHLLRLGKGPYLW
jgi:hypothetical protein